MRGERHHHPELRGGKNAIESSVNKPIRIITLTPTPTTTITVVTFIARGRYIQTVTTGAIRITCRMVIVVRIISIFIPIDNAVLILHKIVPSIKMVRKNGLNCEVWGSGARPSEQRREAGAESCVWEHKVEIAEGEAGRAAPNGKINESVHRLVAVQNMVEITTEMLLRCCALYSSSLRLTIIIFKVKTAAGACCSIHKCAEGPRRGGWGGGWRCWR